MLKETRRLDILALIGGVLALAAIIGVTISYRLSLRQTISAMEGGSRKQLLKCMPTPDMRADLMLPESLAGVADKSTRRPVLAQFEAAAARYPDSARLQFRLGRVADEPQASEALRRAAQLDPGNALPLYVLAHKASAKGHWDEAMSLLTQANRRSRIDAYPFPLDACKGNGFLEMQILSENSSVSFPCYAIMRRNAVDLRGHASQLHSAGKTQDALVILAQLKDMGWKLMRQDQTNLMDVLVGIAIIKVAEKPEKQIYTSTGDKAGLARIEHDEMEFARLRAGCRAFADRIMDNLMRRLARFAALSVPTVIAGAALVLVMLASFLWWGILALRSRRKPASEIHLAATAKAFPAGRLFKIGAFVAGILAVETVALVFCASALKVELLTVVEGSAMILPAILMLGVLAWASIAYKRAYRQAAESAGETISKPWKGYPVADKRERQRRLTGVFGGVMAAIFVWGMLVSGYMKVTIHAFPWQVDRAAAGLHQEEPKYVRDLLAGKVKVPEKYIREAEQRAKQKPGGRN